MKMSKLKFGAVVMAMSTALFLTGCKKPETLEDSVNNRWKAVIANDLEKAYEYFSPGYKEIENLLSYRNRIATAKIHMNWRNAAFKSAKCESESLCKVLVDIDYTYTFPRRSMGSTDSSSTIVENWIIANGKWRFIPKES